MLTVAKVVRNAANPNNWNVEQFDEDGTCLMAIFVGPGAEDRAREYAAMRNRKADQIGRRKGSSIRDGAR